MVLFGLEILSYKLVCGVFFDCWIVVVFRVLCERFGSGVV